MNLSDYRKLLEASRHNILSKSRQGSPIRYNKRHRFSVSYFRGVVLDELFNHDYFIYAAPLDGETDQYKVVIAFPGVLTTLKEVVKPTKGDIKKVNYMMIIKALRIAFDKTDDVRVRCTCPDFKFRYMYWADYYGYLFGKPTKGTEKFPEIRNPDDNIGATCKHLNVFLANKIWLQRAAASILALIRSHPDKAKLYLYDEEDLIPDEEPEVNEDNIVEDDNEISTDTTDEQNSDDDSIDTNNETDLD